MPLKPEDLELVESYKLDNETRYRFRVKGTNIVLNVAADSPDAAIERAIQVAERIKLDEFIEKLKKQSN